MQSSPAEQVRIDAIRQNALAAIEESEAFMDGHFDYGNGYHGHYYLNPHAMFEQPYRVVRLAQDLIDILPSDIKLEVELVAGPVTCGAELAFIMAPFLDSKRDLHGKKRILHAPIHSHGGRLALRPHYRKRVSGRNVLIVDDVRNTGGTLKQSFDLIAEAGGVPIATAVLYDLCIAQQELPVRHQPLLEYPMHGRGKIFPQFECTMCKLAIPITKF